MPTGLDAVLQSPFLGATENLTNTLLALGSRIPGLRELALPSTGVPVLTHDETAAEKDAQIAVKEDVRAQLGSMSAADEDLTYILELLERTTLPGSLSIVHGDRDPLADSSKSRALAARDDTTLDLLHSDNHVLEHSPSEQGAAVDAMAKLLGTFVPPPPPPHRDVTARYLDAEHELARADG